jgi:hypothetical protein
MAARLNLPNAIQPVALHRRQRLPATERGVFCGGWPLLSIDFFSGWRWGRRRRASRMHARIDTQPCRRRGRHGCWCWPVALLLL